MTDALLFVAQQEREDRLLDEEIDRRMELLFQASPSRLEKGGLSEASTVGPDARHKLRFLLRYYAKKDHPFTSCVQDNMKRFGPNRTERVCATVKDIIRGTTHWRGHPELDHGAPGAVTASDAPEIDAELAEILLSLSPSQLEILFFDSPDAA